jgi:thiol-disulfide isomerase/thioredoxin
VLLAVVLVVAVVAAGGGQAPRSAALSPSAQAAALAGSPAVLATLHHQAGALLGGGTRAFRARLRQLRGYPVVINKWASWCGPCQTEFPAYQRASVAYGRKVAFIGIDGRDSTTAASAFLRRFPVSYPSYTDPNEDIARAEQAATYYPQTVYIDRRGVVVFDHAGPYATAAELEHDIQRYVLR